MEQECSVNGQQTVGNSLGVSLGGTEKQRERKGNLENSLGRAAVGGRVQPGWPGHRWR